LPPYKGCFPNNKVVINDIQVGRFDPHPGITYNLLFSGEKGYDMEDTRLEGKTAVVTGGRRGIGRAIALALAGSGADIVIADVVADDGRLEGVAAEIKGMGRRCLAVRADISSRADVEAMTRRAVEQFNRIDILVNCAGVWIPGQTLIETPEENWDKVVNTNLKGTYFCCQAVGKVMVKEKGGNIINLSSQVGLNPGTGAGAYSVSKAGIIMLTRQLALELAAKNIRVNALAPGIVKTDFNREIWGNPEAERRLSLGVPLGRLAEPEDVARAAVFLASKDSSYITGSVIPVDGGWRAGPVPRDRPQTGS
jgi:NAD(P)-dependent dehydrogenase (short-subunit alcohol dehydrogenase family)